METKQTDLLQYKCPSCGGQIEFNSSLQKMKCPYCDTTFEVETLKQYDEFLTQTEKEDHIDWQQDHLENYNDDESKDMNIYICQSCGGEIIGEQYLAASSCPFCGNPVIIKDKLAGELKPDYIIPFKIDRNQAKEALKLHMKGKFLLPSSFKKENHIDEIKGMYVPFWLFDSTVDATARYRATRVNSWSSGDYRYTETKHYAVIRQGVMDFENIPVDGSTMMDDQMMESIEPFKVEEMIDFQTAYLSGFLAHRYDVSLEESISRANERMKKSAEDALQSTIHGYSSVSCESSNIQMENGKDHYAMYPVYLLNTTWNGKKYTFVMNGQTGKFVGDLPVDNSKFFRWLIILWVLFTMIIFAIIFLIMR